MIKKSPGRLRNQSGDFLIIMEMLPVQLISAFAPSEEMISLGVISLPVSISRGNRNGQTERSI